MVTWGDNLLDQRLTQFLIFFIENRKKKKTAYGTCFVFSLHVPKGQNCLIFPLFLKLLVLVGCSHLLPHWFVTSRILENELVRRRTANRYVQIGSRFLWGNYELRDYDFTKLIHGWQLWYPWKNDGWFTSTNEHSPF